MEEIIDNLKDYINTRIRLSKLTFIDKALTLAANLVSNGLVVLFLLLSFVFLSFALGFYISALLDNTFGGFFIVALFYFIIALIIFLTKDKYIEKSIINYAVRKIMKGEEDEI